MVIFRLLDLTSEVLAEAITRRSAGGILILIPDDYAQITAAQIDNCRQIEHDLLQHELAIPIYFAVENSDLEGIYDTLNPETRPPKESYQFVVDSDEPQEVSPVIVSNVVGWLEGDHRGSAERRNKNQPHASTAGTRDGVGSLPTIAVVAFYDNLGVAPGLARGFHSNGSGVVGLLALARMFSQLYSYSTTKGSYNLIFVLTGAGRLNFAGTKDWLTNASPRIVESLDLVLCLDSIAASDTLYLHTSKPPKDELVKELHDVFFHTAHTMDIPFHLVHKKVNISNPELAWEHEQFSLKRLFAATISNKPSPHDVTSSMFLDMLGHENRTASIGRLTRNIHFIGESLARYIFNLEANRRTIDGNESKGETDVVIFNGSTQVPVHLVEAWADTVDRTPRNTGFLSQDSDFLMALEDTLGQFLAHQTTRQTFNLPNSIAFYGPSTASMTAYQTKSFVFELVLTLGILTYLGTLMFVMKGPREFHRSLLLVWDQVKS